jgi:hypothetical protein
MKKTKYNFLAIFFSLFLFFYFLLAIYVGYFELDPDFGWHLQMGKIILKSGIPKNDPFSYTMSSFPFIDHEWLSNIFLFLTNKYLGKLFLSIFFSTILFLTLYLRLPKRTSLNSKLITCFLILNTILFIFGIRLQVISWLLLAIILNFFNQKTSIYLKKGIWFLPFLMLIWVNLHGSFIMGLGLIFIKTIFIFFEKKTNKIKNFLIFLFSFLSTLTNPYFLRVYKEIYDQASDSFLKKYIAEWTHIGNFSNLNLVIVFAFVFIIFIFNYKFAKQKIKIFDFILLGVFSYLSVNSIRHIPLFFIFIIPYVATFFTEINYLIQKNPKNKQKLKKIGIPLLLILIVINSFSLFNLVKYTQKMTEETFYPKNAVQFLKNNPDILENSRIFSNHGWGGYLIYNLPKKKVFLDGRMNSWRNHNAQDEDDYIFYKYIQIMKGEEKLQPYLNKYNVNLILWKNKQKKTPSLLALILEIFQPEEDIAFEKKLENFNWNIIYQDENSIIYQKP